MTGALLRTGNLKAFEPLGAMGNPVYLAAPQLRAAIGRRLGDGVADTLAIPRRNQNGDTIDWYAPGPGSVVPWTAATPEERTQANEQVREIRERIEDLGRSLQSEETGERQTFGHLLQQVTSFPGDDHVYLVDGRPVITFWGFRQRSAPVGGSPLVSLDAAPPPAPRQARRSWLSWWWLLLPLFLLATLLVWLLRGCEEPATPRVDDRQEATSPTAPASAGDETSPVEEPAGEETTESNVPADRYRSGPVLRGSETRILERDGITAARTRAAGAAVEVDLVSRDPVDGVVLSEDKASTNVLDTETEPSGIGTLGEQSDEDRIGGEDPAPATGQTEGSDEAAEEAIADATALETSGVMEPAAQRPLDEARDERGSPEHAGEPPLPVEAANSEPPPGGNPDSEVPDSLQPPESAASEATGKQGDSAGPQIPGEGPKPAPAVPHQGNATSPLELPPGTVGAGSIQFLNGGWRTSTSLQDPRTALPVDMEYQLKDGAGSLSLRRSDGSVCKGQVRAVIENGKLVVRNARDIRCPDGTNFGRPRLECVPGKDSRAECSGRYETGESFSVDIKKSE